MKKEIINDVEYNEDYYRKEFERNEKKSSHYLYKIRNVMELVGDIKEGERILDIGTCSGTFAFICARNGAISYGTDLSKQAIDYCMNRKRKEGIRNVYFTVASSEKQPFESDYFDKIILGDIVEHLPKDVFKKTIKECYRLLKYGGKLIIYTPNKKHIFEILKKHNFILKKDETHINLMWMDEIKRELNNNGFLIEKSYFKPSHIRLFNLFELFFSYIPLIGDYFKRRICIVARKEEK